jgi:hypothetical protein
VQVSETRVEALLYPSPGEELGFRFSATGHVLFQIQQGVNRRIVFIGASGFHPAEMPFVTLSSDDPNVVGIMLHTPGVDEGVYLGYEPSTHTWTVLFSTPAASPQNETRVTVTVDTQTPITQTAAIGFNPNTPANAPVLLLYNPSTNRFVDRSQQANLSEDEIYGNSVVAGDFDNDMDLDLYVVCTEVVLNSPNVLYENRGAGRFRRVANGGGAIGSERGRGDTATVVDYNLDGFLDLLVTNGQWPRPFSEDGPTELFRNRGNKNHWIEIDLVGTRSCPHGIGASVILQTPDGRRQLREQSGGMHLGVQNHKRLHFGLGSHTTVTSIQIYWPSGAVQTLTNLTADRILKVVEP